MIHKLLSLIERLREKPKEVRVQVSFLTALCVTGIVGLLWGVTLPTRLQGFPQADATAQAETGRDLASFFGDSKNNLGQLIGATGEEVTNNPDNESADTLPESDAYRVGVPEEEPASYWDDPFEQEEPGVAPVNQREVRISTTTSRAGSQ